ncbi:hypothetical protein [Lewinella sp. 4G2]|uniref:hypothetical protein n=1 Tax=Lewinella sp. 4G2 TaxID=1803372 RepID=UPI0007B4DF46|nr:hypothetical protein [Lewinella sp. 4G2]OAV46151.1 hypothetical protein A3850_017990 [Lewinella sp. 4G2]
MDDRLLDKIAQPFNIELEERETMREMIDEILPAIRPFSEPHLDDEDSPLFSRNWVRMTDNPGDTVVKLHTFSRTGEIMVSNDGEMDSLSFKITDPNRIIIGEAIHRNSFLFELAFMDNDFLILVRHGNERNFDNKYIFYAVEHIGTRLKYNEALTKLVTKYRNNAMPWWLVVVALLVIAAVVLYLT